MKNNKVNIFSRNSIITSLIMGYIIFLFTPYMSRNIQLMTLIPFLVVWVILNLINLRNVKIPLSIVSIFLWILYIIILKLLGYSTSNWGNYFVIVLFWVPIYLFWTTKNIDRIQINWDRILNFLLLVIFVNIAHNLFLNVADPNLAEFVTNSGALGILSKNTNIGDTIFSSRLLLITPLIYYANISAHNKFTRFLAAIDLFAITYYQYSFGKTIALIFMLIVTVFLILKKNIKNKKNQFNKIIFILIILIITAFSVIIPNIIPDINIRFNEKISERFNAIEALVTRNDINNESFSFRLIAWKSSISTFLENPLLGEGYHFYGGTNFSGKGVGEHSEIFDNLGRYGFVGVILISINFFYGLKFILINLKFVIAKDATKIVFILFFAYSLFNSSIEPGVGFIIFYLTPLIIENINREGKDNEVKL